MRKYRNYTDQDIVEQAAKVSSMRQLLISLNLRPVGGNYANMKRNLARLHLKTSHWHGQAWNKGEQLKDWSKYTKITSLKKHLLSLRGSSCELCYISSWLAKPLILDVHHIDGSRANNSLSNLQLLCPNCHRQT